MDITTTQDKAIKDVLDTVLLGSEYARHVPEIIKEMYMILGVKHLNVPLIKREQKKPNRVVESMTKVDLISCTVRVWRTYENPVAAWNTSKQYTDAIFTRCKNKSPADIAEYLDSIPSVAAYEILDKDGNGIVVYPDWN